MAPMRLFLASLAAVLAVMGAAQAPVHAQAPEKKQITLGVGGKTALYYLPLTIAERRLLAWRPVAVEVRP